MHSAIADLALDHLYLVYAGPHQFPLTNQITAIPAPQLLTADSPLAVL